MPSAMRHRPVWLLLNVLLAMPIALSMHRGLPTFVRACAGLRTLSSATQQGRLRASLLALRARRPTGFGTGADGRPDPERSVAKEMPEILDAVAQMAFGVGTMSRFGLPVRRFRVQLPLLERRSGDVVSGAASEVWLVGTNHLSVMTADLTGRVIEDVLPSALVLELCKERLDFLVRGKEHRMAQRRTIFGTESDLERRAYRYYGEEDRVALRAFRSNATARKRKPQRLLVLADMLQSMVSAHEVDFALGFADSRSLLIRNRHIAENVFAIARLGHRRIVVVVGAAHLDGLEEILSDFSVVDETSSALGIRTRNAASSANGAAAGGLGAQPLGLYIKDDGIDVILNQQDRLRQKVPAKRLRNIIQKEDRGDDLTKKETDLLPKVKKLSNSASLLRKMQSPDPPLAIEPQTFRRLHTWWEQ